MDQIDPPSPATLYTCPPPPLPAHGVHDAVDDGDAQRGAARGQRRPGRPHVRRHVVHVHAAHAQGACRRPARSYTCQESHRHPSTLVHSGESHLRLAHTTISCSCQFKILK